MYQIIPREPDADEAIEDSELVMSEADSDLENSNADSDAESSSNESSIAPEISGVSDIDRPDVPHYYCRKCGRSEPIQPHAEIYARTYRGEKTAEDYSMDFYDPTLARTRQYHCPKKTCATHKNPASKEAIITKTSDGQVVYLCTVCKSDWHPVFQ